MQKLKEKTIVFIDIDRLEFDPNNPRLPKYLFEGIDVLSETHILNWMLKDATIIELMLSVGEHGYFPGEPLLVVENKRKPSYYIVLEGNRRLAAVKLLNYPEQATTRKISVREAADSAREIPKSLPIIEFEDESEVLYYLGYRHVTGIKEWDTLAKARYLRRLAPKGNYSQKKLQEMARGIGSRADYVARLLVGLGLYERVEHDKFYDINGLDEESVDFTLITTALSYTGLVNFLGLESATATSLRGLKKDSLQKLIVWLFEKRILDKKGKLRARIVESR